MKDLEKVLIISISLLYKNQSIIYLIMEIKTGDIVLAQFPTRNIYAIVDAVLENGKYIITELKSNKITGEYQPEGEPIKVDTKNNNPKKRTSLQIWKLPS